MSEAINPTTHTFSTPYLTVAEYKQAPTAIDYSNVVTNSSDPAVQDAELANVIARASSWINSHCNQVLGATSDTETLRARISNDGSIRVHPRFNPVVAVTQFSYGFTPTSMAAYPDCSNIWMEDQSFLVPYWQTQLSYSNQGPLQFGLPSTPRAQVYCQFTYVNGYATGTLSANSSVGATSLVMSNGVGVTAGTMLTIYDGLATENVLVANTYSFGSTTLPLVSPTQFAHTSGVAISALPPAVKQAAILATTAMLKSRGDSSMTMQVTNLPTRSQPDDARAGSDWADARELLKPFRRIL